MESVLGRYRNLIILVGVLFLQVLGLAVQVKRNSNDAQDTRLIRIWAVGAITPFERGLVWIENSTGSLWHNYFYLRGVRAENRQLKQQIEQMRLEQVRLSEDAAQARRLQTLLAFKEQFISKTVAAQVIGSSGSDLSRVIYIDKGENAGVRRDMAVMTADGVVGKVLQVYPSVAQVLLINDQSSGVGVIMEKTRLQGVLRGAPNGEVVLERVMSDEQVAVGETVLTSGGDQIFPKGLPVGTVTKVGTGKEVFLNIKVKPTADLSKLEEVLVLVEKQDREATADDTVRVRAADILAQRLPTVPDKPAADANAAPAAPAGVAGEGSSIGQTPSVQKTAVPKTTAPNATAPNATVQKTAVQKTGTVAGGTGGAGRAAPAQAKPASAAPKPPKASPDQTTSQPPADQDSPH
ncbi:MAG TPA: rod shape-determining protein MreC [Candidatus Sulfotelmatobacter sp.]|nr:rod shape-determining protein MreC [Candidatus Sulfotelmatobacter sp.]